MIDLERKYGPLRLRAYGLAVNFAANAVALYGLSQVLSSAGGWPWLVSGAVLTLACIITLSAPARDDDKGDVDH